MQHSSVVVISGTEFDPLSSPFGEEAAEVDRRSVRPAAKDQKSAEAAEEPEAAARAEQVVVEMCS